MKFYTLICAFFLTSILFAQNTVQTTIRVADIKKHFTENTFHGEIPISDTEKINLLWQKKETSFSHTGIRSFIGYNNGKIAATLSVSDTNLYGYIFTDNEEIIITEKKGFLNLVKNPIFTICNTNENNYNKKLRRADSNIFKTKARTNSTTPIIQNTNTLRVYRLAILVDYSVFSSWQINNDIEAVKTFWSNIELFLNEVYIKELGIKFELIKDKSLIIDVPEKEVFRINSATGKRYHNSYFTDYGTSKLNQIIGKENYDLGVVLTRSSNGGGLATLYGGYKKQTKGAATSDTPSLQVIAHEIGHLFGGRHTFSNSHGRYWGDLTEQTELTRGFSIMSYGAPRDFFSLSSIELIRSHLVNKPYYKDKSNKDNITGAHNAESNIPYGIEIKNEAPQINKSLIQPNYTLPRGTAFQFYIHATDVDQNELTYAAQQRDVVIYTGSYTPSKTRFFTKKGKQNNNNIEFKPEYTSSGAFYTITDFNSAGTATFWLSSSDEKPVTQEQITKYDLAETQVNFVDGIPFRITSEDRKSYQAGDKVQLTWDVDNQIFKNTKVRILMSDDFGETYKYTLVTETANNGSCEVTIPPILLGEKTHYDNNGNPISTSGNGIFKIEVLNHIAFALSNYSPKNGGFTIENSKISFYDLPPNEITINGSTIPKAAEVKAQTSCSDGKVTIKLNETKENNLIIRTWTATDNCNNSATFTQRIHLQGLQKPTLEKITGECSVTVPIPSITDNFGEIITGTTSDELTYDKIGKYTINWTFDDGNGNITTATQQVEVTDNTPPTKPTLEKITGECSVTVPTPTTTDNCSGEITGTTSDELTYDKIGKYTINWTFDDGNGNITTATQQVEVTDNTPPAKPTLEKITGECSVTVPTPTTTDNCTGKVTGTTSDKLTYDKIGKYTINWTFDDGNGNITTATQQVEVTDNTPPAKPILEKITGECSVTVATPTTTDNCTGKITGTTSDELTYDKIGKYTINWTFDDGNGNITTATQQVEVTDNTPPAKPTLEKITRECSVTVATPTTTDNCTEKITGTTSDELTYDKVGKYTINWTFDDGNGNITTATQQVEVSDNTPPAKPTLEKITGECSVTVPIPTTTDNCIGKITGTTSNELTYDKIGKYTITWTFDDGNGNITTATQQVEVTDNTPPAKPTLEKITGECSVTVPIPATTDNCSGKVTGTTSDELTYNKIGKYTITWTFDDGNGNITTATQQVEVTDNTPPAKPTLEKITGECSVTVPIPTTTDNCTEKVTGTTSDELTYDKIGKYTINWTFDDGNGNRTTATQQVEVTDKEGGCNPIIDNDGDGIPETQDPDDTNPCSPNQTEKPLFNITEASCTSSATVSISNYDKDATYTSNEDLMIDVKGVISGFKLGATYTVIKTKNNCTTSADFTLTTPTDCNQAADCEEIWSKIKSNTPQIITPNNDGINDKWEINELKSKCTKDNELIIFNKWGEKVYEKKNYMSGTERFSGLLNNDLLPSGIYFYVININGEKKVSGYLYIISLNKKR